MELNERQLRWPHWIDFLKETSRSWIIAYGTLINKHSIGQTVGESHVEGPVVALGVRRVFSFALVDENYDDHGGRYTRSEDPRRCATLNVEHTGVPADRVNGILFSIKREDIDPMAKREFGYDLLPVEYERDRSGGSAYMFIARQDTEAISHRVRRDILPNESSLKTCLSGAATYGKAFLEAWIASCYLADGTPLMEDPYYRDLIQSHPLYFVDQEG